MKNIGIYIAILVFLIPTVVFGSFDTSLKYGSKGDLVIELQDFLTDQGFYTGKLDGRYGFGTLKAVKAFQTANDLKSDGYFGKGSRAKANEILLNLLNDSNISEKEETGIVGTPLVEQKTIPVSIVNNTPIEQPIINITPISMKDLIVTDISEQNSTTYKFRVEIKDDNGNKIEPNELSEHVVMKMPYIMETTHDKEPSTYETRYENKWVGFEGNKDEVTFTPQTFKDKISEPTTLTFTYKPLNLLKTITIN